jgi:hypothetical protein
MSRRQVLIDGDHRGEVAAQTQQAQNGISWHVQAAQPDSDESRGAKFPTVLRKEVSRVGIEPVFFKTVSYVRTLPEQPPPSAG